MPDKIYVTLLYLLAAIATAMSASAQQQRPNVVLVITDDQGYGDFSATGNQVIETPHLDALARDSTWFTNYYVSPVCSPTRACLMTGRYNYRTRVVDTWQGRSMMEPDEVTIAEVLAEAGYRTGIFGKWHLGDCYPMRPQDQGFSEVLIHRGGGLAQPSEPLENQNRYTDAILFHNGEQVETKGYCTDVYFKAALEFMDRAQAEGLPFFAYIATNAPHGPFHDVPEDLRKHYLEQDLARVVVGDRQPNQLNKEVDQLARIAAMITNIDQNVGRLLSHLEEQGLAENTLVVFMVDNGPNTRRYVGPFRGMKSEVYEGGVRSPLWLRWPARIEAGRTVDTPAAHIDLLPTIAAACAAPLPEDVRLDGRNLLPLTGNAATDWPERDLVLQTHRGDTPQRYHHFMLRRGDWKLVHPSGFGREQLEGEPQFELYNLADDPGEEHNLVGEKPEKVAELRAGYDRWFDDVSSTRPDNYAPPRIVIGTEHEPRTVLTHQDARHVSDNAEAQLQWLVTVADPGDYRARLLFRDPPPAGTLTLKVGSHVRQQPVEAGATELVIDSFDLAAGDAVLIGGVMADGKMVRQAYQVEVEKR